MNHTNSLMMGLLLIPSFLFSQEVISEKDFGIYFTPSLGGTYANYKNLNTELQKNGYSSFNNLHYGVGLDLSVDYKNLSGFFHIFSSLGQTRKNKFGYNNSSDILSTELGLEYRFNLDQKKSVQFSLFASRGSMLTTFQIEKPINAPNFSSALNSVGNITSLDNISNFWAGGVGIYWWRRENLRYNLKTGYRLNEDVDWIPWTSDFALPNSPKDNLSGIFLSIGIDININVFRRKTL
jgi:hypothetical protein